jgi:hypothetical protein
VVDRNARGIAAGVIRDFMRGTISNREYERLYPKSESDPALCGNIRTDLVCLFRCERALPHREALAERRNSLVSRSMHPVSRE